MMRRHQGGRRRLVLFPCPLQGHLSPMLELATLLHTKGGFYITVVHTLFNSPNPSNYPHFDFEPISDGVSSSSPDTDGVEKQSNSSTKDVIAFVAALNVNCVNPFKDCLLRLISSSSRSDDEQDHIACIIADAAMHFTQDVADSLQLPRIVLRTSSITSFVAFAAFPLLLQKGYLPIQESELETPVKELPPLKVKDLPVINTKYTDTFYELVDQMVEKARYSSGIIWNSFEPLEQQALDIIRRDFHNIPIFPIGPFHKWSPIDYTSSSSSLLQEDHSCISWLDRQAPKSVVYVSFGSLADMDESELVETAWGLVNSGQPFLWVVRPGLVRRESNIGCGGGNEVVGLLPDGFEDMIMKSGRGCLVKWAPQQEVLAHPAVGGFWTHCGWNSTLESVCQGVPMLCRPCFTDQKVNARYVSEVWKLGFQFENGRNLERGEVEREIRRLMEIQLPDDDDDDEKMLVRVRVREMKEKADLCLKEGGSSFQSIQSLFNLILSF